jgi:hypothetical protein
MASGSPDPVFLLDGQTLWVSYIVAESLELSVNDANPSETFAVLRFEGVRSHKVGPPSDERIDEHPLRREGLSPYGFFQVSPGNRWIITFRDETLEVVAVNAISFPCSFRAKDGTDAIEAARRAA